MNKPWGSRPAFAMHAPAGRQRQSVSGIAVLIVVAAVLLAVVLGLALGAGAWIPAVGLAIAAISGFLLLQRHAVVLAVVWGALTVAGLVELYLPGLQAIRWLFAGLSIALLMMGGIARAFRASGDRPAVVSGGGLVGALLVLFVACVVASDLSGRPALGLALAGVKNYLQMWGLLAALAWFGYSARQAGTVMRVLMWVSVIQLPFVLHQFLVLVPQRTSVQDAMHFIVAVDIVSGTFGGDMRGGGRSADLAVLSAITITLVFGQWQAGYRRLRSALPIAALSFLPLLLNEAKLAFVLIPLGLAILLHRQLLRKPLQLLVAVSLGVCILAGAVVAYQSLPSAEWQRTRGIDGYLKDISDVNFGNRGYGGAYLNRTSVYKFWWTEHVRLGDARGALFGHGVGTTNYGYANVAPEAIARYKRYAVGLTGASTLLWEMGVLGLAVMLGLYAAAYRYGGRVWQRWRGTPHAPLVRTAQIGMALYAVTLLHNNYVSFDIGYQTMFAVMLGYLFAMGHAVRDDEDGGLPGVRTGAAPHYRPS